jgi:sarcosine oxidase, subunit gamma
MADPIGNPAPRNLSERRLPPPVARRDWLQPLAPRARFTLRGGATAQEAAGRAFGLPLPTEPCRSSAGGTRAALWLGPDEQLLIGLESDTAALRTALEAALAGIPHSLVDVSHRQTALEISGPHAADILNGASPLDLSIETFPVGMCTRTVLDKSDIVLWRTRSDAFHIEVWRSFTDYVASLLGEIGREFHAGGDPAG